MRCRRILARATTSTPSAAASACGEKNALSRTPGLARNHGLDRRGATDGCTIGDASPAIDERMTAEAAGVFLDYSKNRVEDKTLSLLVELAEQSGLRERIDAMFRGEKINVTENRAVLHVALRAPKGAS